MIPTFELRHLRYVIAVAEELHFTRAAKRLHLSVPALSTRVKELETDLGYQLFVRNTREVVMTPAGVAFVAEARQAIVHVERAIECGRAASRGDTGVLSVGYTPWIDPSPLSSLGASFEAVAPGTRVVFHSEYTIHQIDLLLKGSLNVGLVLLPIEAEDLQTHCIWREPLVLAIPAGHLLAAYDQIALNELLAEPMIWLSRSLNPVFYTHMMNICQQDGLVPRIVQEVVTVTEQLDLVANGVGVALVRGSLPHHLNPTGVVFKSLINKNVFVDVAIAYRADSRSEGVKEFVKMLRAKSNCDNQSTRNLPGV